MAGSAFALVQSQDPGEVLAVGQWAVESVLENVPSQRVPRPTLLRYLVQSVSAWDHSPQMVGPQLFFFFVSFFFSQGQK